jgi:hypothetical protein
MAERDQDPRADDDADDDEGPEEMIEAALDELANPADETNEG